MITATGKEISCRVTRTLLMYVREQNNGSLGTLLDGLDLDEEYLLDVNNWVSHAFLHILYHRMFAILHDDNAVYKMALASGRFQSLGLVETLARLLGNPRLIYAQAPKYNRLLKLNGDVYIHQLEDGWAILEDRYHNSAQKTRYDCDYARGILVGVPTIFDMPPAQVEEIECQVAPATYGERAWPDTPSLGAKGCLYRVRWGAGGRVPLRKRLFGGRAVYRKAIDDLQEANRRIQEKYDEVRRLATDLQAANRRLIESRHQLESYASDLRQSEERYRFLAENVSDIIWTLSLETMRFTYASPSVRSIRGFTTEEATGLSLEETLTPQSLALVKKALADELAREGKADPNRHRTIEIQQLCKDGSATWAEATMSFIRNADGRPVGVLGVTRDISERKQAEAQRDRIEALGTLAGGIAHDFNNILASTIGFTEMAMSRLPAESPARLFLDRVFAAGIRGRDLVKQILMFSRRAEQEKRPLQLARTVGDTLEFLHASLPSTMSIHTDIQKDLGLVLADRTQMQQVVMNLCTNAAHAMRHTGGDIFIELKDFKFLSPKNAPDPAIRPGLYVSLVVRDTGEGMSPETVEHIFDPFFTTKVAGEGTGLGLSVVHGIVASHGGVITVSSRPGRGSTFTVYLPMLLEVAVQKPADRETSIAGGHERILFIDDEEDLATLGAQTLNDLGYCVTPGTKPLEALALFSLDPSRFDLVITDQTMPELGGIGLAREILALRPDIPIVLCTGFSETATEESAKAAGIRAFVMKPLTQREIARAVRQVLDGQTMSNA
jgi:PAS domain S-box-containing protein